jgi:hypothetical protein
MKSPVHVKKLFKGLDVFSAAANTIVADQIRIMEGMNRFDTFFLTHACPPRDLCVLL